jgi:carbamate kinase
MYLPDQTRTLVGVEAVIDKDLASELLARELEADLFVIATDVKGVYLDWGKPEQRLLSKLTPAEANAHNFPAGSMGPKVAAAVQFVEKTGKRAAIGSLEDIEQIVAGEGGTNVVPE